MYHHDTERPRTPSRHISSERAPYPDQRLLSSYNLGGNGFDRFIPQQTSKRAYRASPSLKKFDLRESELKDKSPSPERLSSPGFFSDLRTTGHYDAISHDSREDSDTITPDTSVTVPANSSSESMMKLSFEQKRHREFIADCLGFQSPQRVLMFHSTHRDKETGKNNVEDGGHAGDNSALSIMNQHHHYLRVDPIATALPPSKAIVYLGTRAFSKMNQSLSFVSTGDERRPSKRIKSQIPYRVLDAPSLRNDFYSNLISWSKTTDNIMVGLGCSVYIWSDSLGAVPVLNHEYLNDKNDIVTCVSFSPKNTFFIVGTKQGRILLFDQQLCLDSYRKHNDIIGPLYEYQTDTLRGISCVHWSVDCSVSKFLVGEESGIVTCLTIKRQIDSHRQALPKKKPEHTLLRHEEEWWSRKFSPAIPSPKDESSEESRNHLYNLECTFKFQAQSQQICGKLKNYSHTLIY